MKKVVRNLVLGSIVATILATGAFMLKKKTDDRNIDKSTLDDPRIEKMIVYKDGSIQFLLDFSEEYGLESEPYIEKREEEIDYIEIYNEDGTKEIIDYDLESSQNKTSSHFVKEK